MRIVITGNMGYVGPVLVRHLRACFPDAELVGIDSGLFAHCLSVDAFPERLLDRQIYADVRDIVPDMLRGADAVVHLAAVSNDPMGSRFEAVTEAINWRASARVAEMAAALGVGHFVFASSCSIYGFAEGGPRSERDALNPLTAYARSKIETERALQAQPHAGMVTTALRFATACGFSDRTRLDLVLNDFVASAMATGRVDILSDGTPWRPLIHVADMARAIEWAIARDAADGGHYLAVNAGADGWNHQVGELARGVADAIEGVEISVNMEAPPDRRSYRVDFSLFRSLAPRHQPRIDLATAIGGLRAGLAAAGFDDAQFRARSPWVRLRALDAHIRAGRLGEDLRWTAADA